MTATSLNFALLDANWPEVARLIAAMVQARDPSSTVPGRTRKSPPARSGGPMCVLINVQIAAPLLSVITSVNIVTWDEA
jgi:hypothetical protein